MVKRYATRAGLDGSMIGAHSLRVGHVTQALENGAMPHLAQSQMRHKRIDTTMGYDRNKALKKDNTSGKLGL
jgi:site-specific recombinase XerD